MPFSLRKFAALLYAGEAKQNLSQLQSENGGERTGLGRFDA